MECVNPHISDGWRAMSDSRALILQRDYSYLYGPFFLLTVCGVVTCIKIFFFPWNPTPSSSSCSSSLIPLPDCFIRRRGDARAARRQQLKQTQAPPTRITPGWSAQRGAKPSFQEETSDEVPRGATGGRRDRIGAVPKKMRISNPAFRVSSCIQGGEKICEDGIFLQRWMRFFKNGQAIRASWRVTRAQEGFSREAKYSSKSKGKNK